MNTVRKGICENEVSRKSFVFQTAQIFPLSLAVAFMYVGSSAHWVACNESARLDNLARGRGQEGERSGLESHPKVIQEGL